MLSHEYLVIDGFHLGSMSTVMSYSPCFHETCSYSERLAEILFQQVYYISFSWKLQESEERKLGHSRSMEELLQGIILHVHFSCDYRSLVQFGDELILCSNGGFFLQYAIE